MKLKLLFIVMDLLIVLAYPIVFVHSKLRQFSKPKDGMPFANRLVTSSVIQEQTNSIKEPVLNI